MNSSAQPFGDAHVVKCELAAEVLRSSGTLRLRVMGWSMLPAIWPGDTLLIEHIDAGSACEGDIVLFGRDRRLFAHRVVTATSAPEESELHTQGDAMHAPDPPVSENDLMGRVSFVV